MIWARILGADFGAEIGCAFERGFWVRILGQVFGSGFWRRFLTRIHEGADFQLGVRSLDADFCFFFWQKAANCRTVHVHDNPQKIHTQYPAGRRLSAGRHAKGSKASS